MKVLSSIVLNQGDRKGQKYPTMTHHDQSLIVFLLFLNELGLAAPPDDMDKEEKITNKTYSYVD
jgi:hypothetical protein